MDTPLLKTSELTQALTHLPNWQLNPQAQTLERHWELDSFQQALRFINTVADIAEKHNHHPQIISNYKHVSLILTTHSCHRLTQKDVDLAHAINNLELI